MKSLPTIYEIIKKTAMEVQNLMQTDINLMKLDNTLLDFGPVTLDGKEYIKIYEFVLKSFGIYEERSQIVVNSDPYVFQICGAIYHKVIEVYLLENVIEFINNNLNYFKKTLDEKSGIFLDLKFGIKEIQEVEKFLNNELQVTGFHLNLYLTIEDLINNIIEDNPSLTHDNVSEKLKKIIRKKTKSSIENDTYVFMLFSALAYKQKKIEKIIDQIEDFFDLSIDATNIWGLLNTSIEKTVTWFILSNYELLIRRQLKISPSEIQIFTLKIKYLISKNAEVYEDVIFPESKLKELYKTRELDMVEIQKILSEQFDLNYNCLDLDKDSNIIHIANKIAELKKIKSLSIKDFLERINL